MDINPETHDVCNLEMIRMYKENVRVGSGHVSVEVGANGRVLTPINVCHFNANSE